MPERPMPLVRLEQNRMHQLASSATENKAAARRTLGEAAAFRQSAQMAVDAGLNLPGVSNFHEAARLAITAIATVNGRRFSNMAGSHEAVVDYALAMALVDKADHARLDALRQLRHDVNYPADLIEPSSREIETIVALVDRVIAAATKQVPPRRISPPPAPRSR